MDATEDSAKPVQGLLIGDLARHLALSATVQRDDRTGNPALGDGLSLLAARLRPYKSRPVEDLATLSLERNPARERESQKPPIELPDKLDSLDWDRVKAILEDDLYRKWQIVELGARRFGIPRGSLSRLNRADVIESIRAALDHERSLDAIGHRARIIGERRTA